MAIDFEFKILTAGSAAEQFTELLAQSFLADANVERQELEALGYGQGRVVYRDRDLAGGLVLIPMAQWFGGKAVPMTGVASVAISPHYRGQGAAQQLMRSCLQELHHRRVALSTLYPAAQGLYRRVGYGHGGSYCCWQVASKSIQSAKPGLPVQPLNLTVQSLKPLYERQAQAHSGCLQRAPLLWQRLLRPQNHSLYCYGFGPPDALEGYVLFNQSRSPGGSTLEIRDWVLLTAAAAQSFWGFMGAHRSQIDTITWRGGAVDRLGDSLPEQTATIIKSMIWMTRIVHLEEALLHRGYPPINAELHLRVQDPLLSSNQGLFCLTVQNGQPSFELGGRGELELTIDALASLYTGIWSARQLHQMGLLQASEPALATANVLFRDSAPWLSDFF